MHIFNLPRGCVLLLATWLGQGVVATSPQTHRSLKAATKRTDLYKRSARITKRFDAQVDYVEEENGWAGTQTFASQVKVSSQKPVLNLEEVEHYLQDVQCGDGKMKLSFVDTSSARDAYFSCRGKNGGLVITSHDSCNVEGERAVYRVHDVSFADDGETLELSVDGASWQDAFDSFDISFGHTTDDHIFRRHSDFAKIRKRQKFNIDIPASTPDDVTTGTFDLKSELIDTTFPAESFLAGLEQIVPIPQLPIEIGCRNCSTRGQIVLKQGAIKIDASQIDLIPDIFQGGDDGKEITSVVSGGFIELAAIGVGAHIELFARPKQSGAFEIALFPLPVLGFVIPGIGKAGAAFEPRIAANFEISGGFELNYGIDVSIPDNSVARLELTNIAKSGITGFPGSKLTPLPFKVNITDVDILLGLAFKPTIPVGFEFLDKLKAEVFVSMNLPRLDAKLSTNAAANCGNSSNATLPGAPYANKTTEINGGLLALGPLVLVEANVSVTIDVGFGLNLPLLPPPFGDVNLDANIFSTVFPLVTACVDAAKSFPPMTASTGGNATATPSSATLGSNSTVYVMSTMAVNTTATRAVMTLGSNSTAHKTSTAAVVATSSPCTDSTVYVTLTETHTVTMTHSSAAQVNTIKSIMSSSHAVVMSHIIQTSSMPASLAQHAVSSVSTHSSALAVSIPAASSMVIPSSATMVNSTIVEPTSTQPAPMAPPFVLSSAPPFALSFPSPAPTAAMSSSLLGASNSTIVAAPQQSGPAVFTGAATPGVQIPVIQWDVMKWQVGVMGLGVIAGAVVL